MAEAPRDSGVFGALDSLEPDDAMDPMLLNLPAPEPADWALDPLATDLYSYMEPPLPTNAPPASPPAAVPPPDPPAPPQQRPPSPSQLPPASSPSRARKRPPPPSPSPSSTSGKRVPTAVCSNCGKAVANNGANFRRHETACRRSRAPVVPPPRDEELFHVVQRLHSSIASLDVSARVCLRDALLSLSNKAANPTATPTPQQEAMNRAAEYLVLRMLFLSGAQLLMHTAPGTAPPYPTSSQQADDTHQHAPERNDGDAHAVAAGAVQSGAQQQLMAPQQQQSASQTVKDEKTSRAP
ncbi:hypothetical protein FGB62_2g135 [Gracilaria domingensis]|nr:hypothetical protein FGB62_2g135 [Gracilaria domingensis]